MRGLDADDYREIREESKKRKDMNRVRFEEALDHIAYLHYRKMTEYQYRFFLKSKMVVDIYPSNQKWHNITLNERGTYGNAQYLTFLDVLEDFERRVNPYI